MDITFDNNLLDILLILLPGFIVLRIASSYRDATYLKKQRSAFETVSLVLLFSVAVAGALGILNQILRLIFVSITPEFITQWLEQEWIPTLESVALSMPESLWKSLPLYLMSIVVGLIYPPIFARWKKENTTGLDSDDSWDKLMNDSSDNHTYIVVTLHGNVVIGGWLARSSEATEPTELILEDPIFISPKNVSLDEIKEISRKHGLDRSGSRLLITRSSEIELVHAFPRKTSAG